MTAMSEMLDSLNEQIAMNERYAGRNSGNLLLVAGGGRHEHHAGIRYREQRGNRNPQIPWEPDKGTIMRQFVIEAAVTSPWGASSESWWAASPPLWWEQRWASATPPCRLLSYPSAYPLESDCCSDFMPASRGG